MNEFLYNIVMTQLNKEIIDYNQKVLDRKLITIDDNIMYHNDIYYKQLIEELKYFLVYK